MLTFANGLGAPAFTASVNERHLWPWEPELIVSIGYLNILSPATLEAAPAINCHYSLLPWHRGRSSVPWAILEGDQYSGITWHWIDEGIDTGRILAQAAVRLDDAETQASLFRKLHDLAIDYASHAIQLAFAKVPGIAQQPGGSYHGAGPPNGGEIDKLWTVDKVDRFIRAMIYPPLPPARFNGIEVRTLAEYYDSVTVQG